MKLFKLTLGSTEVFGVAKNQEEMYEKRAELDPVFEYTPVVIEEVKIDGHVITVTEELVEDEPVEPQEPIEPPAEPIQPESDFETWFVAAERADLKKFLEDRNVEFDGRSGEDKLRELVLANA